MILEMKVPSPGESITEVEIASWLVEDGDYVEKDQPIAEVDSDKATLELPAEESGIITLKAEEGDAVEVGAVVCLIDMDAAKPEGDLRLRLQLLLKKKLQKLLPSRKHQKQRNLQPMQVELLLLLLKKSWTKKESSNALRFPEPEKTVELPKRTP